MLLSRGLAGEGAGSLMFVAMSRCLGLGLGLGLDVEEEGYTAAAGATRPWCSGTGSAALLDDASCNAGGRGLGWSGAAESKALLGAGAPCLCWRLCGRFIGLVRTEYCYYIRPLCHVLAGANRDGTRMAPADRLPAIPDAKRRSVLMRQTRRMTLLGLCM